MSDWFGSLVCGVLLGASLAGWASSCIDGAANRDRYAHGRWERAAGAEFECWDDGKTCRVRIGDREFIAECGAAGCLPIETESSP